jgi:REP element-mobilizing transposase RayT
MPRRPRIHQPGGFYHVTLRGNHQRDIFFSSADRALLNSIVAKAIETYDARVHAYCWMSNHIHLLMQVGDAPLAESMRQIAGEYARAMLSRMRLSGHLFERRYFARLVGVDSYLLELVRYIHLNPVTANLAADPASYLWSSHHNYLGRRNESWVTCSFALEMFGSSLEKAIAAYLDFVGSEDALEWRPPEEAGRAPKEKRAPVISPSPSPTQLQSQTRLHNLIAEACRRFEVSLDQLQSPARDPYLAKVRGWIASQARQRRITSLAEVARALGRDEGTLRYAMRTYPGETD